MDEMEKEMPMARQEPPARRATTPTPTPTPTTTSSSSSSSSSSHAASRTPPASIVPWARADSCYFPGCRKDANCSCDICLASIHATRDLVHPEAASARSFFVAAKDRKHASRPLFGPDTPPPGSTVTAPDTPPLHSTAKSRRPRPATRPGKTAGVKKAGWPAWACYLSAFLGFLLLWWADSGLVPEVAARGFGPKLSPEAVMRLGTEARLASGDLEHQLGVLQLRIGQFVGVERVSNCSSRDSVWKFKQNDHHVFHWRCTVYKSAVEKVSVWGSPLRTSGLIPVTLSVRHLIILSGKITEWSDGRLVPIVRASNCSSWSYRRQSTAAVLLESETWVLEYERSVLFEGTRLMPATVELLMSRGSRMVNRARRRMMTRQRFCGGTVVTHANPT